MYDGFGKEKFRWAILIEKQIRKPINSDKFNFYTHLRKSCLIHMQYM